MTPAARARPQDFLERSPWRGAAALVRDWAAIVAVAALSVRADSAWVYLVCAWVIGAFQFAIGESLLHEAAHGMLFPRKKLNEWLEPLYALPFFRTVEEFRGEHMHHHAHTGEPDDALMKDYDELGLRRPGRSWFWIWFVRPVIGYAGLYFIRSIELRPARHVLKIAAFWAVAVSAFALAGRLHWLVLYWLVPFFWCHYSFLYWSEIQDHFMTHGGTRSNVGWLLNAIQHNNGFHAAHHRYPAIPWHRLPEAHAALCGDDRRDDATSFIDTYRHLRRASAAAAAPQAVPDG
jgi:fatty acid desaturase